MAISGSTRPPNVTRVSFDPWIRGPLVPAPRGYPAEQARGRPTYNVNRCDRTPDISEEQI